MSSIVIDTIIKEDEKLKKLISSNCPLIQNIESVMLARKCKQCIEGLPNFKSFFIEEVVRIIIEDKLHEFNPITFPWEKISPVVVDEHLIDFKMYGNNLSLKCYLFDIFKDDILESLKNHIDYDYYIEDELKLFLFKKSNYPQRTSSIESIYSFIETNIPLITNREFYEIIEIKSPSIKQEIIDQLPRFYDYKENFIYKYKYDDFNQKCLHSKGINRRIKIVDNGDNSITLKLLDIDIYNPAIECINLLINECTEYFSIIDNYCCFIFNEDCCNIDYFNEAINWIKEKQLPLKLEFNYKDKLYKIYKQVESTSYYEYSKEYLIYFKL